MKKMLLEYIQIVAYTVTGLIFGFSFFLLFLNFYHMKEVHIKYEVSKEELELKDVFLKDIKTIKENIGYYSLDSYPLIDDKVDFGIIKSSLDSCVNELDNESFFKIISKSEIDNLDVYELQKIFQNDILNECFVEELYALATNDDINISSFKEISPFVKNNISQLLNANIYLESSMKNNSSYFFSSNSSKIQIFDTTKEGYHQVIRSYRESLQLMLDFSSWYKNVVGGYNEKNT